MRRKISREYFSADILEEKDQIELDKKESDVGWLTIPIKLLNSARHCTCPVSVTAPSTVKEVPPFTVK